MTLARVSIEPGAWTDPRFAMLARLLGLADAEHAIIRCARVWAWQTDRFTPEAPTYEVSGDLLETLIAPGAPAALVRAGLAEEAPGGFRIRGSGGRIEWLANLRRSAAKGGQARAKQVASRSAENSEHHDNSDEIRRATRAAVICEAPYKDEPGGKPYGSQVASQTSALLSGSGSGSGSDLSLPGSGIRVGSAGPEPPDLGATRDRVQGRDPRAEEQARILRVIGAAHVAAHTRMRQELGFDSPGRKGYVPAMRPFGTGEPTERTLRELLGLHAVLDGLEERLLHVLAVAEFEARREGSLRWFGPTLWSKGSYDRAISMAVGEDRRPARASPAPVESLTAKSLRRVRELQAIEAEEERAAQGG